MNKLILALMTLWFAAGTPAQNIIINGGFESPGLPSPEPTRFLGNDSNFLPGWTVIDDGIGERPFYAQGPNSDAILAGNHGLILNQGSGVKTTFRAEAGSFYELSFWLRPGDCLRCITPAPLQLKISGRIYTIPLRSGWSEQKIQFYATNSINTLEFLNPSSPSDSKQFGLDEISVIKTKGALLGVRLYPGVIVDGFVGQRYQIQAASDLNAPQWESLTNIFLTNSPVIFIDMDPKRPLEYPPKQRIYRAIQVP